ncbi:MAG TPA: geranylgeranylglycerol-phosphate geranylgeranyltransferase [Saprospiraceae bacterium]|nr:geranylgeranylglycerol-phosphate geranylgeranyltransferase [Saprospiraceae bacterium]
MIPFIQILRPKNLIIVGITQWILYHYIILAFVATPSLDVFLFSLLVIDTMLIAAGGYVINDIIDAKTDQINKPSKTYIPSKISLKTATYYYYTLLTVGFLIALYIAYSIDNLPLVIIYPSSCFLLYLYSTKYKNSIIIGNVLVSLFVAMVSGIILFAERNAVFALDDLSKMWRILELFFAYMVFSFMVNMIREIIKDMEDMEGDKSAGLTTYPIKYGADSAKKLTVIFCALSILVLVLWLLTTNIPMDLRVYVFLLLLVASPLVVVIQILTKTTTKRDFSKISAILKYIMLSGLVSIILLSSILKSL